MNWGKVLLIIEREFMVRVRTKLFLISTLLVPVGFVLFFGVSIAIQFWDSEPEQVITIVDRTGVLADRILEKGPDRYRVDPDIPLEELRTRVQEQSLDGILLLEASILDVDAETSAELLYAGSGGMRLLSNIEDDVREAVREARLERAQVGGEIRAIFEQSVRLESRKLTQDGQEEKDHTTALSVVGFIMGLIIFVAIFSYGAILMRGVIEEKSSRIIEVIASSVKPIELLIGKILGISAVAVLQFSIWIGLIVGISAAIGPVMAGISSFSSADMVASVVDEEAMASAMEASPELEAAMQTSQTMSPAAFQLPQIEASLIVFFFLFFIGGYFLYASLFAAIGSAVESESDSQQLMTPVSLLIMFAYFFNVQVMQNPDTTLAVIVSLIPFFAPINMITRIAISEVPWWQIAGSLSLLILTTWGILAMSARIYRVGILQFGTKAGFKDLLRWIRQ